jgi:hypothetical protein
LRWISIKALFRSAIDIVRPRDPRERVPIISMPAATVVIAAIAVSRLAYNTFLSFPKGICFSKPCRPSKYDPGRDR